MRAVLLSLLLLACAPGDAGLQSPIDLHLVVHIDPLPRRGDEPCVDDRLRNCGGFSAGPWRERVDNLAWLSDRWSSTGRTLDLQWGPEMASILTEDPAHLDSLAEGFAVLGEADPNAAVAEGVSVGQGAVQQLLDAGAAAFAVHVHTVAPDPSGLWGTGPLAGEGGPHPCEAWQGDPLVEAPAATTEAIVHYGAVGGAAVSERFGAPLRTLTGAVPRVMANKSLALTDPDALDPDTRRDFPAAFSPWRLGGAYSECMLAVAGHPPFELYQADEQRALGGGEGPLVHPGEPVVGSMSEHLDLPADGAPGAVARRILTAMLNWRVAALSGEADRPWAYSFHTHLFHLDAGDVALMDPEARDLRAVDGLPFRQDLEDAAAFVDRFAGGGAWQGVAARDGGSPLRWGLPGDADPAQTDWDYGDADSPPPTTLDGDYPYLPLVARTLADTHVTCTGSLDGVQVFGLQHCAAGWSWGGSSPGFHCADDADAAWRYVLVPEQTTCLSGVRGRRAASVAAEAWGAPRACEGGLVVPPEGLLLEPDGIEVRLAASCTAGLGAGG